MARPQGCRRIHGKPACALFVPQGGGEGEAVVLRLDELEALRLSELEGLEQEPAAERMGVSRPTFGRILASARRRVAEALVKGLALRIEGGRAHGEGDRLFTCEECGHCWAGPRGPNLCPECRGNVRACACRARVRKGKRCCGVKGMKASSEGGKK